MTAAAAAELALVLLPKITIGVEQFITWIATLRTSLKQTGEWTVDFEAAWKEGLLSHNLKPEEIPD